MIENKGEKTPKQIIEELGLTVIDSDDVLETACKEAIENNPKAVDDYLTGNEGALNFVVGQVMRATRGRAQPNKVVEILKKLINK